MKKRRKEKTYEHSRDQEMREKRENTCGSGDENEKTWIAARQETGSVEAEEVIPKSRESEERKRKGRDRWDGMEREWAGKWDGTENGTGQERDKVESKEKARGQ